MRGRSSLINMACCGQEEKASCRCGCRAEQAACPEAAVDGDPAPQEPTDRLAKNTPFRLILWLSYGPFLAELVGAGYSIVDSYWIGRTSGETGLAAMSLASLFDSIARAFGVLIGVASSSQFARLRGGKQHDALPQLFADLFRVSFIVAGLCAAILLPSVKPLIRFFGATPEVLELGYRYVVPLVSGSVVTCLNLLFCGILQSEGRSLLYGAVQVSGFLLNGLVFDPIFMVWLDKGMFGAGLATVCAEAVPMLICAVCFCTGKFETRSSLRCLVSPFSPHIGPAIKTGISQFISHVCFNIPSFFSRKYVSIDAEASGNYTESLAAYNIVCRLWSFATAYATAVSVGFLPAASYAVGAEDHRRVVSLWACATGLSATWCVISEGILLGLARYIAMIFGKSEGLLDRATTMIRISYLANFAAGQVGVTMSLLQTTFRTFQSAILAILTQFLPVPAFGSILFFTDPSHDIFRLMYMYTLNDAFGCLGALAFTVSPIRDLWRSRCRAETEYHGLGTEALLASVQESSPRRSDEI
jgi:Na+-driven multidrug efflux pump